MKTSNLFLAASVVLILNFSSCKKYEDGPGFSLKSKTGRLTGEWEVVQVYDSNGQSLLGNEYEVEMEFEKDGDFEMTYGYSYGGQSYSYTYKGDWEWESDKSEIEVVMDGTKQTWEITRLTSKELQFEDEDGNEWELEAK
ncbi:MAG: hypothetical protein ACI8Q1_001806 [Parvicella sp.]|jgi:hypothetical protein